MQVVSVIDKHLITSVQLKNDLSIAVCNLKYVILIEYYKYNSTYYRSIFFDFFPGRRIKQSVKFRPFRVPQTIIFHIIIIIILLLCHRTLVGVLIYYIHVGIKKKKKCYYYFVNHVEWLNLADIYFNTLQWHKTYNLIFIIIFVRLYFATIRPSTYRIWVLYRYVIHVNHLIAWE